VFVCACVDVKVSMANLCFRSQQHSEVRLGCYPWNLPNMFTAIPQLPGPRVLVSVYTICLLTFFTYVCFYLHYIKETLRGGALTLGPRSPS
jgi:hypothetical protein